MPAPPLVAFASRRPRPFYSGVAIDKLFSRRWITHCLLEARQQTLDFTPLRNISSYLLTDSYSGRQPPVQPIFLLAAWGRHSPRWWCGADTRGALSRDHGGMLSVLICSCFLQQNFCPRNPGFITYSNWRPHKKYTRFYDSAKCLERFNRLVSRQTAADSARFFASSVRWAKPALVVGGPPAARSLAIAEGVASVSNSSGISQQTACPRNSGFIPHN